jgi:hypothetical protein
MLGSTGELIGHCNLGGGIFRKLMGSTPARCRRTERQNCPGGGMRRAERDLRGRLSQVLIWIPAEATRMTRWML